MSQLREAAQQALEALEWIEPSGLTGRGGIEARNKAITNLRAALAEPVQEPVAWQWLDTAHFRKKIPAHATPAHWRPLYTAPPQRKPLTDEEIYAAIKGIDSLKAVEVARAIERAHGITGPEDRSR